MSWGPSILLVTLLGVQTQTEDSPAKVLWLDFGGKGQDTELSIAETWPLGHFTTHMPWWDPVLMEPVPLPDGRAAYRSGGPAPTNKLFWQPLDKRPSVKRLGTVGGIRAFQIVYSPTYHAVVWDRGGWSFVPAVIIAGHESILVGVHVGRVFRSHDKEVLHVRIQFQGTGHNQQSLFFTAVDGRLVLLEQDESARHQVVRFFEANHIRSSSKGLGFCEDSLTEEKLFDVEAAGGVTAPCVGCRVVVRYRLEGAKLFVSSIGFLSHEQDCEMFPKW